MGETNELIEMAQALREADPAMIVERFPYEVLNELAELEEVGARIAVICGGVVDFYLAELIKGAAVIVDKVKVGFAEFHLRILTKECLAQL